jgi:hypothetical protein
VGLVDSADGAPLYAAAERQGLPVIDTVQRGLVTRLIPRIDGGAGEVLSIRIGAQEAFNKPINWATAQLFTIGQTESVDSIVEGRFFAVRIEGATLERWRVHSYRLEVAPRGLF